MEVVSARRGSSDQGIEGRVPERYEEKRVEMSERVVGRPHWMRASAGW